MVQHLAGRETTSSLNQVTFKDVETWEGPRCSRQKKPELFSKDLYAVAMASSKPSWLPSQPHLSLGYSSPISIPGSPFPFLLHLAMELGEFLNQFSPKDCTVFVNTTDVYCNMSPPPNNCLKDGETFFRKEEQTSKERKTLHLSACNTFLSACHHVFWSLRKPHERDETFLHVRLFSPPHKLCVCWCSQQHSNPSGREGYTQMPPDAKTSSSP